MTDIPVIFSAPMVQALLAGRKQMTRRLGWRSETDTKLMSFVCDGEKPDPLSKPAKDVGVQFHGRYWLRPSPWQRVKVGDRLWVRETTSVEHRWSGTKPSLVGDTAVWYWADGSPEDGDWTKPIVSIHMPRRFSRLTLIVTGTKVERLAEMSEADAASEGCQYIADGPGAGFWTVDGGPLNCCAEGAVECFERLWESLHGADSWRANPEVVCLSFEVRRQNIDKQEARAA